MNFREYVNELKKSLANKDIDALLERMKKDLQFDSDKLNMLIFLHAQFFDLNSELTRGVINIEQYKIYHSRTLTQLLSLIDDLDEDYFQKYIVVSDKVIAIEKDPIGSLLIEILEKNEKISKEIKSINDKIDSLMKFEEKSPSTIKNLDDFINECNRLISFDDLRNLFLILKERLITKPDQLRTVLLLNNRWNKNEKNKRLGQLDINSYNEESNRLILSLISLLEELKEKE